MAQKRWLKCPFKKEAGVYKMINTVTHDFYIGSSRNIQMRYYSHWSLLKNKDHDNHAIREHSVKYGRESFSFEVLEYCDESVMRNREQYYMDLLKPSYNRWTSAFSAEGLSLSAETIAKLKKPRNWKNPEARSLKLKAAWQKRRLRPDGLAALRMLNRTGKPHTQETLNLFSKQRIGKPKSMETRQKIREARLLESENAKKYKEMIKALSEKEGSN